MKLRNLCAVMIIPTLLFFASCGMFFSCASNLRTSVTRPAQFDLKGADTIAVLPFRTSGAYNIDSNGFLISDIIYFMSAVNQHAEPAEKEIASYLTKSLVSELSGSDYLTLVGSAKVEQALRAAKVPPVDVYITGEITRFSHRTTEDIETKEVEEGKFKVIVRYRRTVDLEVLYQIIDSRTNKVLASRTRSCHGSSLRERHKSSLPSPLSIIRADLDGMVSGMIKEMQPYEEYVSIKFLGGNSRDVRMRLAKEYVRLEELGQALELYELVYDEQGIFEAGYNAALIYQARGELYTARERMSGLFDVTGDRRASRALSNLEYEIAQSERLSRQIRSQEIRHSEK